MATKCNELLFELIRKQERYEKASMENDLTRIIDLNKLKNPDMLRFDKAISEREMGRHKRDLEKLEKEYVNECIPKEKRDEALFGKEEFALDTSLHKIRTEEFQ